MDRRWSLTISDLGLLVCSWYVSKHQDDCYSGFHFRSRAGSSLQYLACQVIKPDVVSIRCDHSFLWSQHQESREMLRHWKLGRWAVPPMWTSETSHPILGAWGSLMRMLKLVLNRQSWRSWKRPVMIDVYKWLILIVKRGNCHQVEESIHPSMNMAWCNHI